MSPEVEARRLRILVRALRVKQVAAEAEAAHYAMISKWLWKEMWSKA